MMRSNYLKLLIATIFTLCATDGFSQVRFDDYFVPKTLRFDFALSGNGTQQKAYIQAFRQEPIWAGGVKNLIDPFGYGGYMVNVYDSKSDKLIYSRGFNTLFEEWRTTDQAKSENQSWTNSVVVPFPKNSVLVEITGRNRATMLFESLLRVELDPNSIYIDRSPLKENKTVSIVNNGSPTQKVDLVFIAEGYTAAEQTKFFADAQRFSDALFAADPFDKQKSNFNVWAVGLVSEDSGTDISGEGIWKNTALNSGFYTFGIDRYLTTLDMKSIRDAVWNVPCDAVFILVNSDKYGGGGMYNFYGIGTADNQRTIRVFVHELGHSLAGLGDEYFSSEVAYNDFYDLRQEPWEPNLTTLVNFKSKEWSRMISKELPIPTPVDKTDPRKLGVFEGGGYVPKGIYRPMDDCMMRSGNTFCPVCSKATEKMIKFIADL